MVVALMAACVIAIGALFWTAARLDSGALEANRELASRVLALFERSMLRQAGDYANWEDMFEHAHLRMDEEWAAGNMGPWVEETFDIGFTFVVGPDGATRYAWYGSARRDDAAEAVLGAGFRALLARSLGRPAGDAAVAGLVHGPDGPVLVALDAIRRPDGTADLPAGERSTLVFGRALDGAFLGELAEATGLAGLRLVAIPPDAATLRLVSADGSPLGALTWRQDWPGWWLRRFGIPPSRRSSRSSPSSCPPPCAGPGPPSRRSPRAKRGRACSPPTTRSQGSSTAAPSASGSKRRSRRSACDRAASPSSASIWTGSRR